MYSHVRNIQSSQDTYELKLGLTLTRTKRLESNKEQREPRARMREPRGTWLNCTREMHSKGFLSQAFKCFFPLNIKTSRHPSVLKFSDLFSGLRRSTHFTLTFSFVLQTNKKLTRGRSEMEQKIKPEYQRTK